MHQRILDDGLQHRREGVQDHRRHIRQRRGGDEPAYSDPAGCYCADFAYSYCVDSCVNRIPGPQIIQFLFPFEP
jgi:hypothetical protein